MPHYQLQREEFAGSSISRDLEYHVPWINQKEVPILVLKYEDLLTSPKEEFGRLAKFLKINQY